MARIYLTFHCEKSNGMISVHHYGKRSSLHHLFHHPRQLFEVLQYGGRQGGYVAAVGHGDTADQLISGINVEKAFGHPLLPVRLQ